MLKSMHTLYSMQEKPTVFRNYLGEIKYPKEQLVTPEYWTREKKPPITPQKTKKTECNLILKSSVIEKWKGGV